MANHLIAAVEPGSIAEELGIEPGDALVSINVRPRSKRSTTRTSALSLSAL